MISIVILDSADRAGQLQCSHAGTPNCIKSANESCKQENNANGNINLKLCLELPFITDLHDLWSLESLMSNES